MASNDLTRKQFLSKTGTLVVGFGLAPAPAKPGRYNFQWRTVDIVPGRGVNRGGSRRRPGGGGVNKAFASEWWEGAACRGARRGMREPRIPPRAATGACGPPY